MESLIAGAVASFLTLFDLDRTFYVPTQVRGKITLYAWWWGFILANGVLAALLYGLVGEIDALKAFSSPVKALVVGISYLAIIRAKFTTFNYQGTDIPFGFELLYEAAKNFAYKRINNIAKAARMDETIELASRCTLVELTNRATLSITQDQILKPEDKRSIKAWILKVLQDAKSSDEEKRQALATYILSGQIPIDLG